MLLYRLRHADLVKSSRNECHVFRSAYASLRQQFHHDKSHGGHLLVVTIPLSYFTYRNHHSLDLTIAHEVEDAKRAKRETSQWNARRSDYSLQKEGSKSALF